MDLEIEEKKIRFEKVKLWHAGKRILLYVLTLAALAIGCKLTMFYIPFLIAFIISAIIEPFIKFNTKILKGNRKIGSAIAIIIAIILLILATIWLTTFAVEKINSFIQNISPTISNITTVIANNDNEFTDFLSGFVPESLINSVVNGIQQFISNFGQFIKDDLQNALMIVMSVPRMIVNVVITILALVSISKERGTSSKFLEKHFPKTFVDNFSKVKNEIVSTFMSYLKVYSKLLLLTTIELIISFGILNILGFKIEDFVLKSVLIAVVDILPILGVGTVLLPWSVWCFITGNVGFGVALLIVYLIILFVRQFIEPKLVSNQLGVNPLITLIAMYTGFKLIGFTGLIIGPFALMVLRCVYAVPLKEGLFKNIFD